MSLILDFDGTITEQDTLDVLANYALAQQPALPRTTWDDIVQAYVTNLAAHAATYAPAETGRATLRQELDFLESQRGLESASLARVAAAGLFKGAAFAPTALRRLGAEAARDGRVHLRRGFAALMARAAALRWRVAIVSVNWSAALIEGVVAQARAASEETSLPFAAIRANNIRHLDGTICCVGTDAPCVTNAHDKARVMRDAAGADLARCVYVGDSTTDLECLAQAGRGLVIAPDGGGSLLRTLRRLGYECPHVGRCRAGEDGSGSESGRGDGATRWQIAWARDFEEILDSRVLDAVMGGGGGSQ